MVKKLTKKAEAISSSENSDDVTTAKNKSKLAGVKGNTKNKIKLNDLNNNKKENKNKETKSKTETPKKSKKEVKDKFELSEDQKIKLKEYQDEYQDKTNNDLKELLKKNGQIQTGKKEELVHRCAESKLLGALPACPKCSTGKLRFNYKTAIFRCPGQVDDAGTFIYCGFNSEDVKRNDWQE